jgi:hypothetical protein
MNNNQIYILLYILILKIAREIIIDNIIYPKIYNRIK